VVDAGGRCTPRVPRRRLHQRGADHRLAVARIHVGHAVLMGFKAMTSMASLVAQTLRDRAALLLALLLWLCYLPPAGAERIKDLANVAGVRTNALIGYGLVVGLDGTGDQTTQTPFTVQSIQSMLSQLGVNLPPGTNLQLKNVAAVMVTAQLPSFAQPGQSLDVTVSSLGNAKSL